MALCPRCQVSLSRSVYLHDQQYKSCPACSNRAGVHAYHRYEDFGMRTMADGNQIVQSWCPVCRTHHEGHPLLLCP